MNKQVIVAETEEIIQDDMQEPLKELIVANSNQLKITPDYVNKLKKAGLHITAEKCEVRSHGFLVLREEKIIEFLKRICPRVAVAIEKVKTINDIVSDRETARIWNAVELPRFAVWNNVPKISVDFMFWKITKRKHSFGKEKPEQATRDSFELIWNEVPVDQFEKIIPEFALDKLLEAQSKNLFDFYTAVDLKTEAISRTTRIENKRHNEELENRRLRDPLILGRKYNNPERYVIAQWGDDICVDDIL